MRALFKIIGIAVGLTGLLGGALMSMGHLRTAEDDFQQLEMSKLRNLAATWETRLLSARSAFRDLLLRHGVTDVVEHPSEWAAWRVDNKINQMIEDWPEGLAKPRAWVLLRSNNEIHSFIGDSTGLALALDNFAKPDAPDILLADGQGRANRCLALQYAPPADEQNAEPGQIIALMDPKLLFDVPDDPPAQWVLMDGPKEAYLASTRSNDLPIGAGTWGILLSQSAGMVTMDNGLPLAFCRIHVPGMKPLLVVSEINAPTNAGSAAGALLLLTAGTALLVFALRPRRKTQIPAAVATGEAVEGEESKTAREPITFRQIFQAVRTPMCVVDETGRILRVNSAARGLLHLPKGGQPDDSVSLIGSSFRGSLKEFLARSVDPDFGNGSWLLCLNDKHYFDGEIVVTRLSATSDKVGPVAIEFIENRPVAEGDRTEVAQIVTAVDALNPQPILLVSEEGRVIECNRAALDINAKLADSPKLHDVLPGLEAANTLTIVDPARTQKFESLFGSRVFDFFPVPTASGMLLYGLTKSNSQSLQIALHQAQENFNTLCGLCSEAVLLVDPRTHAIQEANLSASDLFGAVHPGLVGKTMDEFAEWPWNDERLRAAVQLQREDGQCVTCSFEHELVKVEGEPTLLVVVNRQVDEDARNIHMLADYAEEIADTINDTLRQEPELVKNTAAIGPGMLVVTNPIVRDVARKMLEHLGHPCEVFTNLDDATLYIVRADSRPEFVMIDLGDFDQPADWIDMLRSRCGGVPCVGLSDTQTEELPDGPNAILPKPFELDDVANSLQSLDLESAAA